MQLRTRTFVPSTLLLALCLLSACTDRDGAAADAASTSDLGALGGAPADAGPADGEAPDAGPWSTLPGYCESPDTLDPLEPGGFEAWATLPGAALGIGDADGNGTPEIYVYLEGERRPEGRVGIYESDGTTMAPRGEWYGFDPLAVGDLDGDGLPEVVTATNAEDGQELVIVRGPSRRGSLDLDRVVGEILGGFTANPLWAEIADVDADGAMELVIAPPVRVFELRDGALVESYVDTDTTWPGAVLGVYGPFSLGDFDGDGRTELVVPAQVPVPMVLNAAVRVIENRGPDAWAPVYWRALPASNTEFAGVGDVDGDGVPEFLRGGTNPGGTCWHYGIYRADGDDRYAPVWERSFRHGTNALIGATALGDTDGDGRAELAVSMGDVVHVFEGLDGPATRRVFELPLCNLCQRAGVRLADLDGDGRADLVVSRGRVSPDPPPDPEGVTVYRRVRR